MAGKKGAGGFVNSTVNGSHKQKFSEIRKKMESDKRGKYDLGVNLASCFLTQYVIGSNLLQRYSQSGQPGVL